MKTLKDYINEEKELEFLNENFAIQMAVSSAFSDGYSSSSSSSSDNNDSTTGQNISALLRCCGIIGAAALGAALTGPIVITAAVVLLILSLINIPYGKFIDEAIEAAKKSKGEVKESLEEEELEYIDEGLKDKMKNLKEKVIKGFAKLLLKNKKIKELVEGITKQEGYDDAKKSFETLSKFVFDYFKKENDENAYKSIASDLKKDKEEIPE